MNITCSESLYNAVDLLSLARKAHIHEQLPNRNVNRVRDKVEALDINAERPSVEGIRTSSSNGKLDQSPIGTICQLTSMLERLLLLPC